MAEDRGLAARWRETFKSVEDELDPDEPSGAYLGPVLGLNGVLGFCSGSVARLEPAYVMPIRWAGAARRFSIAGMPVPSTSREWYPSHHLALSNDATPVQRSSQAAHGPKGPFA